jgi:hypothetical protein
MNDLEPDYKKEYEELMNKVEFFAEIVTLVGVVCIIAFCLNLIIRNI